MPIPVRVPKPARPPTISVSSVAVVSPPMTTVARGRWTSAPEPVEKAIGMNPRLATSAVIRTGRRRLIEAPATACR